MSRSCISGALRFLNHVLGDPATKFDGRKFGYLGAPTANSVICFVTEATGIRTMEQWMTSKPPVILGGVGRGSSTSTFWFAKPFQPFNHQNPLHRPSSWSKSRFH